MFGNNVRLSRLAILILIGAIGTGGLASQARAQAKAAAAASSNKRRALLVGVTKYYNIPNSDLIGPGNDVNLFQTLLTEHYQFKEMPITVLAEGKGGPETRPTKANIEREFKKLAQQAQPGDDVIILLGGHGFFVPDKNPNENDPEPDGLDEVFLPADTQPFNSSDQTIGNAILDDELRDWITAIRDRGAFVWVIMDSCHSGTGTRGFGEVAREANAKYLGIPDAVLSSWYKLGEKTRGGPSDKRQEQMLDAPKKSGQGEWVAMYGAQSTETAPELMLPQEAGEKQQEWHGLLTFTIRQILTQSSAPITYRELMQRVQQQYTSMGRSGPIPLAEGSAMNREVLGTHEWPGRSQLQLKDRDGRLMLNGGTMHGLTSGTILVVRKVGSKEGEQPLGYVKIGECSAVESVVTECDQDGNRATKPAAGLKQGVLGIAKLDYSFLRPTVVGFEALDGKTVVGQLAEQVQGSLLNRDASSQSMIKVQVTTENANWVVRTLNNQAYLIPSSGWAVDRQVTGQQREIAVPGPEYGPFATDQVGLAQLAENLQKIAKAQNLLKLAPAPDDSKLRSGGVNVQFEVRRHANREDEKGVPLELSAGVPVLTEGDMIGFHVTNNGQNKVDVTLLLVDSAFGIIPWFPKQDEVGNRIGPGQTFGPPGIPRALVSADTTGLERVVLIAVEAKGDPVNYTWLAQEGISQKREVDSPTKDLDRLLGFAATRVGTRGYKSAESGGTAYVMRTISWEVKRKEADAKPAVAEPKSALPKGAKAILDNADRIDVYSLGPFKEGGGEGYFHDYLVKSKVTIQQADQTKLAAALNRMFPVDGTGARCFHPGFALTATHAGNSIEMVICFECGVTHLYFDGNKSSTYLGMGLKSEAIAEEAAANLRYQTEAQTLLDVLLGNSARP